MSQTNFIPPSAPTLIKGDKFTKYPELLTDSTNFRIKKIMDDEKLLREEIKIRNAMYKKYGRFSSITDGIEYTLILGDIIIGTLATAIPGVGSVVSSATFSGVGIISGVAKLIQSKLTDKKLKHYKLSVIASTTLNNLHHKISKAISDEHISHEEFEDIQNTMNEWKKGVDNVIEKPQLVNQDTIELISKQAEEKAQKMLLDRLRQMELKN